MGQTTGETYWELSKLEYGKARGEKAAAEAGELYPEYAAGVGGSCW